MAHTFTIEPPLRLCAAALNGDAAALETLAASPEHDELITSNRIAPGLAIRASELGVTDPQVDAWLEQMRASAVQRIRLEHARGRLAAVFAQSGIRWAPLKGLGFDRRIYPRPEERLSTDLDVLISPDDLDRAVDALVADGWRNLITTERQRRYVRDEGYNWKASSPDGSFLELHFRLWGGVPERFAPAALDRAEPAPDLGPGAGRVSLPDAYIIAAVHAWQTPAPRYLMLWWDLHRIASAMNPGDVIDTIGRTDDHGLQLFVALSASVAADLWGHPVNHEIADESSRRLRLPERRAAASLRGQSPRTASLGVITLARLLANRSSRSGWRAVPRQVWAHPGTVETDTPDSWSWPRRRLTHVARKLHLAKK